MSGAEFPPQFPRLVWVNSGKKSSGLSGIPTSHAATRMSDCRLAGMFPRTFQDETVVGGSPSAVAVGRTPPNSEIIRSTTALMMSNCTHGEFDVNSISGQTVKSLLVHYRAMQGSMKDKLKNLEDRARLSGRQLADRANIPTTTYQNYKARNTASLPLHIAQRLAEALEEFGIPRQEVMALSGYPLGRPLTEDEMTAIKLLESASPGMRLKMLQTLEVLASPQDIADDIDRPIPARQIR